ncbi:hypothetical protein NQZ68_007947 [Dissostichus eleginoides]|nr:hypothetical protein NQZ68_007947 [Dissostichus eleginoides]
MAVQDDRGCVASAHQEMRACRTPPIHTQLYPTLHSNLLWHISIPPTFASMLLGLKLKPDVFWPGSQSSRGGFLTSTSPCDLSFSPPSNALIQLTLSKPPDLIQNKQMTLCTPVASINRNFIEEQQAEWESSAGPTERKRDIEGLNETRALETRLTGVDPAMPGPTEKQPPPPPPPSFLPSLPSSLHSQLRSEAFSKVGVEGEEVVAVVAAPCRPSQANLSVLVRTWNTEQTAPEPRAHYAKLPTLLPSDALTAPTQHFLPRPTM